MGWLLSYVKFLLKMRIVGPLRSFFLLLFGARMNKNGWERRLLIINPQALGDLIVFTSVLKHYKRRFPGKKIYLLIKSGLGIEEIFKDRFADEIILLQYRRFAVDPLYGAKFINALRRIGFGQVINHDFSVAEPSGKIIAVNVGAKEVMGYEGMGLEYRIPFDIQQKKTIFYIVNKIFPRYTKLVPRIDRGMPEDNVLPSAISHYIAIYEGITGYKEEDYSTILAFADGGSRSGDFLRKRGLEHGKYAVVSFGASVAYKRWPAKRFAEALNFFKNRGAAVVLVGSSKEGSAAREFIAAYKGKAADLTGKTSLLEFLEIISGAIFVFTNDSATVHAAVAAGVPSLCISGGGQFGMFQDYGFSNINRWVYKKTRCYGDNWRCGKGIGRKLAPCVEAISTEEVKGELESLIRHIGSGGAKGVFRTGRLGSAQPGNHKIKVIYAGVESENYNPARRPSFEYSNFYLPLKAVPGISVIEYPYEPIVTVGKKKFNQDLLDLIRSEKPNLFFAFMYTDELDVPTLQRIKRLTKSVAWFADDQRRIHNYSRFWAPHFTLAVTTWSRGPETYARYGIRNVVRSQWACGKPSARPPGMPRDIGVSFVGQRTAARAKIIGGLRGAGIPIFVRGFGWPEGRAGGEEMAGIIDRSKINLNINDTLPLWSSWSLGQLFLRRSTNKIVPGFRFLSNFRFWRSISIPQIKARPFELAGRGAFVVSGYADDFESYYKENEEMVFYRSVPDLIEKIKYYLGRDEERERIARAGYERTLREHTYEKRFEGLFEKIGLKNLKA